MASICYFRSNIFSYIVAHNFFIIKPIYSKVKCKVISIYLTVKRRYNRYFSWNLTRLVLPEKQSNFWKIWSLNSPVRWKPLDQTIFRILLWTSQLQTPFDYGVTLRIQSEHRKILTRKNSLFGHFSRSVNLKYIGNVFYSINFNTK